ncbi:chemotaxis protein CheW [Rhodopila globiformis]|uniref:Chemotaxis protein CheW n=1 Tax=Rhodopila globiformis TaxID=1071 RepID=A0A2S6N3V3_RHOGL|nr:chemotaxis protein CheW [Rhodopila globiformis]PPQ29298.1 chemotaxis protein CheW [Rhodopila globiformis]
MNSINTAATTVSAAPPPSVVETARQFITFTLGAEEYGVDIMMVREIKGWTETTALPKAPPYVRGVINLRGIIVPILDLRARFGIGVTEPTPMHVVIIVNTDIRTSGLLVDAVSDIVSVEPGAVRPVPELGLPIGDQYLEGLVALDDRMVTLVSLDRLLAIDGVTGQTN